MSSRAETRAGISAPALGMALFLSSEVMFFGALFGAYYSLRASAGGWPPEGTPELGRPLALVLTAVLLLSSVTQHRAETAHERGDLAGMSRWLAATLALGALFLMGEGFEWIELFAAGFGVSTNLFGALFFLMTGFHGLHLIAGLTALIMAWRTALVAPRFEGAGALKAATYLWHFVDGVWLVVAFSLYAAS
ncbi:MAG: cytochrome c oxidase subunit 3 [Actinomycetota bacterium]|nr:cytochrome c oxidase subunit 3 [Actinomycetota bacterium]